MDIGQKHGRDQKKMKEMGRSKEQAERTEEVIRMGTFCLKSDAYIYLLNVYL